VTALLFLVKNLDHFRRRFCLLLIAGIIDGALLFSVPLLISVFLRADFDLSHANSLLRLIALAVSGSLVLQFWIRKKGESLAPELANHLRLKIFSTLESLSVQRLAQRHSGHILSLTSQVSDGIGALGSTVIWIAGHAGVTLSLFFIMTARESVSVAATNAVLLTLFMIISVRLARHISRLSADESQARAVMTERFADCVANLQTIKRLHLRSFTEGLISEVCRDHNQAARNLQSFHARRWSILHGVFYLSFLVTTYCLLSGVAEGWIAAPMMVIFISAFTSVRSYLERLSELVKQCMELGAFLGNAQDILPKGSALPARLKSADWKEIRADKLYFSYHANTQGISVPSFTFNRGEIITITGESGQGKSTFLLLLAGLLLPTKGRIAMDGADFASLPDGYPTRLMATVSQETELFNLSIRENLTLNAAIEDQEVVSLLEELGLGAWVQSLTLGLETKVGEKGLQVSAGQKQRLSIARAILMDRPIMVLDEPTSHLDSESERAVLRCLAKQLANRSAIIVSHRDVFGDITSKHMTFRDSLLHQS
jgi:ABC-type bacteriocin/lantibiotic exporter with double-glycine peptidase domain